MGTCLVHSSEQVETQPLELQSGSEKQNSTALGGQQDQRTDPTLWPVSLMQDGTQPDAPSSAFPGLCTQPTDTQVGKSSLLHV